MFVLYIVNMFDYKKSVEILAWLLRKYNRTATKIMLIKLLFFADKYHLRKYGRTVSGDEYKAMNYGPVASKTLNVANIDENWLPPAACALASEVLELTHGGKTVNLIKDIDFTSLSESDIEALSFAYDTFGKQNPFALVELTHLYPEWKKHEKEILTEDNPAGKKSVNMDIRDFLEEPPDGLNPCFKLAEEDKKIILDLINESESFDKFFKARNNVA